MKFRKKPVEIEAVEVKEALYGRRPDWLSKAINRGDVRYTDTWIEIVTLEGVMRADLDDWIIQGVKGELYPCKPDIFAATYDPVITPEPGNG